MDMTNPAVARHLEEMKKNLLGKILDGSAYERLSRVRLVNPTLAAQSELYLLQIYQSGKLRHTVTDEQMKEILTVLSDQKDFHISRK
jgi:DNA-binding TFAR19-related protein (PDSD5 family)